MLVLLRGVTRWLSRGHLEGAFLGLLQPEAVFWSSFWVQRRVLIQGLLFFFGGGRGRRIVCRCQPILELRKFFKQRIDG